MFGVLISILALIVLTTFYSYKRKIACDHFNQNERIKNNSSNIVSVGAATTGVGLSRILDYYNVGIVIQISVMVMMMSLVFTQSIYIVMKYYCYCLLENDKIEKKEK